MTKRNRTTPAEAGLTLDKWNGKPWKSSEYRGRTILQTPVTRPGDWLIVCDTIRVVGLEKAVRAWTSGSDFARAGLDRFGLSNNRSGWLRRRGARR